MVTEDVGTYTLPGFVCDRKLCYLSLGRNKPFIIIIIIEKKVNLSERTILANRDIFTD